jgi:hypothetical protein
VGDFSAPFGALPLTPVEMTKLSRNRLVAKLKGERNCDGFLRQTKIKIDDCSNATIKIFIKICHKKTRKAAAS